MKINKNIFMFLVLFFSYLIFSIFSFLILPEKYFDDTDIIIYDRYKNASWMGSFGFAIMFYKITGLRNLPFFLIALIQFPIISYILYKIGVPKNFHVFTIKNIIIYISFFLASLYMSMPTKEFITFLMFAPIPFIFTSRLPFFKKISYSLLLFLIFSFFRSYYLLVPIFTIGLYGISFIKFENKTFSTIFYGIIIAILVSICHGVLKGEFLSQQSRENYFTENQHSKQIRSAIKSPISQDTWYGEGFGIFYGFVCVNIPVIEGVQRIFSPQILFFVIWELFLFSFLLKKISTCLKTRDKNQLELFGLFILFAYFIVQGIFEPDLGTSIRHKIGFLPLIYFIMYYDDFKRKI